MRGISKTIIGLIVAIVVIIAGVGVYYVTAQKPATGPSTSTTTPVTLTIVTFSGTCAEFIKYAGELFSKEHPGVTVKVITYPFI